MLIQVEDIQKIRSVASNIDRTKVEAYIVEAERLDLIPVIGMDLYDRLESGDDSIVIEIDKYGIPLLLADKNEDIVGVEGSKTTAETLMLEGGKYYDCCGKLQFVEGVKVALAYLAYARLVHNHQVAVTPFGVVSKMGDDSTPTDARTMMSVFNDTRNIGLAMLARCVKFWQRVEECCGVCLMRRALEGNGKRKFVVVGD